MNSKLRIQDVGWRDENNPYLKVFNLDTKSNQSKFSLRGDFSIRVLDVPRQCMGKYDHRKLQYSPCQYETDSIFDSRCKACLIDSQVFWKNIHSLSYRQLNELREMSTTNYIALFPGGVLKTGVSLLSRKRSRILEQGALYAIFFTTVDGVTARYIEEDITQNMHISQVLSWKKKLQKLNDLPLSNQSYDLLINTFEKYKQISLFQKNLQDPEQYNTLFHALLSEYSYGRKVRFISALNYGDELSGTFIALYGTLLLFKFNQDTYALDIRNILGLSIEVLAEQQWFCKSEYITDVLIEREQRLF